VEVYRPVAAGRQEVVMGRAVGRVVVTVAGVIVVGWAALWLLQALTSVFAYLLVGAVVVGGGVYVYGRVRRSLAPGTRNQRRIEAAVKTYRTRGR
jgi:hypothetical protein